MKTKRWIYTGAYVLIMAVVIVILYDAVGIIMATLLALSTVIACAFGFQGITYWEKTTKGVKDYG